MSSMAFVQALGERDSEGSSHQVWIPLTASQLVLPLPPLPALPTIGAAAQEHATTSIHPRAGCLRVSCSGQEGSPCPAASHTTEAERMDRAASAKRCPAIRRRRDRRETHAQRAMDCEIRDRRALRRSHARISEKNGR